MSTARSEGPVIAVTGLHRGESPQPGGSVVASLRRRFPNARVVGLCYDPMESGIYSPGGDRLDASFMVPYPKVGPEALMQRLETVLAHERLDMIIPCLDTEILNFATLEDELRGRGVRLCLPGIQSFEDRDKANLAGLCETADVPAPGGAQAYDAVTLADHATRIGYPCYVKGPLYGARRVDTASELHSAYAELHDLWGGPILVQEAVVGEEYDLVGLGDGDGGIVGHCSIRKLLRTRLGKGFAGVVVEDPAILDAATRVIETLKWNGPFELEFVKVPGRPHMLFEMNPRFPAWVDFASQIGCNLPAALVERTLGLRSSALADCKAGRVFIRHCTDLVADIGDIARLSTDGNLSGGSVEADIEVPA